MILVLCCSRLRTRGLRRTTDYPTWSSSLVPLRARLLLLHRSHIRIVWSYSPIHVMYQCDICIVRIVSILVSAGSFCVLVPPELLAHMVYNMKKACAGKGKRCLWTCKQVFIRLVWVCSGVGKWILRLVLSNTTITTINRYIVCSSVAVRWVLREDICEGVLFRVYTSIWNVSSHSRGGAEALH